MLAVRFCGKLEDGENDQVHNATHFGQLRIDLLLDSDNLGYGANKSICSSFRRNSNSGDSILNLFAARFGAGPFQRERFAGILFEVLDKLRRAERSAGAGMAFDQFRAIGPGLTGQVVTPVADSLQHRLLAEERIVSFL